MLWKILNSKMVLNNPWFKVRQDEVQLPNGKVLSDYFVWESGAVSMVVPITQEGKLILVKQYKHGVGEIIVEFPAGFINENEEADDAARRELGEETGRLALSLIPLGKVIHHPTNEAGVLNLFVAKVGKEEVTKNPDENENIEILELTPQEVLEKIKKGEIWATATIAAFFMAREKTKNFSV